MLDFSSSVSSEDKNSGNNLPVHERLALDELTIAESTWTVGCIAKKDHFMTTRSEMSI